MTKRIIIESPFKNDNKNKFNDNYLYLCLVARRQMKEEKASVLFFHALYTQFLNDNVADERLLGLLKSLEWHTFGDCKLYAIDRGVSEGMILGGEDAIKKDIKVAFYTALPENHWVSKRIAEINAILDNKKRWNAGIAFVNELKEINEYSERFENTGALTDYLDTNREIIKEIENCILEFFAPLVDAIRSNAILSN